MNELQILGTPLTDIEIGATGLREIAQNVKTIITTWRGTVFLDRQFGVDARIIDQPVNTLMAKLTMDLTVQVEKYEPRVRVISITFEKSNIGVGEMIPLVKIKIREGMLL